MRQNHEINRTAHLLSLPYPIQLGRGDLITVVTHATGNLHKDMVLPDGKVIASPRKAFDVEFGPNHEVVRRPAHHLGFFGTPLCKRGRSASANRQSPGRASVGNEVEEL